MPRGAWLLLWAACLAAAADFGVTAWRLIDSPLRFDETDFAYQAGGIIRHGVPKMLYGETGYISTPRDRAYNGSEEASYGMWHPPLYLYSLAGFLKLLGPENWALRSNGLAWFALTAAILWGVAGRQLRSHPLSRWLLLSIALLSPLVAHGIFFIDIDNTSLAFAVIAFASVFTLAPQSHSAPRTAMLSAIVFLALWSKLSTPIVLLVAVGVYHILNRDWRGVRQTVAIGVLAGAAFLLTYLLYCRLTGYPADFMFRFTYLSKQRDYLSIGTGALVDKLHAIWWNIVWFSPALSLLLLALTTERAWQYWRRRRLEPVDFWVLLAWACFGAYAVWIGAMGKYTFPAAVAAATAIGLWLPMHLQEVRMAKPIVFGASVVALLIFQVVVVPALEVKAPAGTAVSMDLRTALLDPRNIALAQTLGGFVAFAAFARRSFSGGTWFGRIAAVLLTCAIVASSVDCFKVMLSTDDRSPYRPFRERGYQATIETLNQRLSETDTLIGPKDVGFYFHGRSYALDVIRDFEGPVAITSLVREAGVSHGVDSIANPAMNSHTLFRQAGLSEVQRVGDFIIYGLTK